MGTLNLRLATGSVLPWALDPWSECSRVMPSGTYLNKAIVQKLTVFPALLFLLSTWMEQPKVPSLESQN